MKKTEKFHYMNAFIVKQDNGDIDFYSYSTWVLHYCKEFDMITINLHYSTTSSKQVTVFINERFKDFIKMYRQALKEANRKNYHCIRVKKDRYYIESFRASMDIEKPARRVFEN